MAAYLSLWRLDNTPFWDDEAVVGILSKNLLHTGQITGWDGRNLVAVQNGAFLDEQLRPRETLPQIWITALSFRLFGVSTWAGRFPFVLIGLATLAAFCWLLKKEQACVWHTIYAFGLFALSVTFLLHIRQCRYYALSILSSVLTYVFYRRFLENRCWSSLLAMTASAVCAFYNQYFLGACFLMAIGVEHLACHIKVLQKKDWVKVLAAILLFALVTAPFAFKHKTWQRPDLPLWTWDPQEKLTLLWWYFRELNLVGCLPWLVAGLGIWLVFRRREDASIRKCIIPWAVLCLAFVFFIAVFSPKQVVSKQLAEIRYLIAILPFTAGLGGWVLGAVHQRSWLAAFVLFIATVFTNIFCINPVHPEPRWTLPAFVKEIHNNYPTSYSEVIASLRSVAKKDDIISVVPAYCSYPLIFYLGDKIRIGCLLDQNTPLPQETIRKLAPSLLINEGVPDWLIAFGKSEEAMRLLAFLSRPRVQDGKLVQPQYQAATNLNVYWFDSSKPAFPWHTFGPKKDFDPASEAIYIFRRN